MDPLAHTLVGAALAETGLQRTTALATPTLVIAANLPDLDVVTRFAERDTALLFRRGLTHGAAAMVVLPLYCCEPAFLRELPLDAACLA